MHHERPTHLPFGHVGQQECEHRTAPLSLRCDRKKTCRLVDEQELVICIKNGDASPGKIVEARALVDDRHAVAWLQRIVEFCGCNSIDRDLPALEKLLYAGPRHWLQGRKKPG